MLNLLPSALAIEHFHLGHIFPVVQFHESCEITVVQYQLAVWVVSYILNICIKQVVVDQMLSFYTIIFIRHQYCLTDIFEEHL